MSVAWRVYCVGEAEIQVRVTDMNDNAPYFTERVYTARVPENTDVGTIVMTVTADDLDEGLSTSHTSLVYVTDHASMPHGLKHICNNTTDIKSNLKLHQHY